MRVLAAAFMVFVAGPAFAQGVSGCGGVSASFACRPTTTVAGLPTCNVNSRGTMYMVTDATAPAALATVVGGGAVVVGVVCTGANWIVN